MWVLVEVGQLYYMLSKVIATAVVMIYNFITRKLFIERKKGDNQMSNKINALQKKWIQFKSKNVKISKKNEDIELENNTGDHGFVLIPKFFNVKGKYVKIRFSGRVLEGNSAIVCVFDSKRQLLGEGAFEAESLIENQDNKHNLFAIKVLAKTKVLIKVLDICYTNEQSSFFKETLKESDMLVITPSYPSLENKYLSGFVHSRLVEYKKNGLKFDVVCSHGYNECTKYSFEGIDVLRVPFVELRNILRKRKYKKILVHFLDDKYASVLDSCDLGNAKLYLWVHGPETLYWDWPKFTTSYFKPENPLHEHERLKFMQNDLMIQRYNEMSNVTWIFVSEWIKERSEELINIKFNNYVVIPNIIDEQTFKFEEKNPELRKKVYFLRRFDDCNKYAIDVNVKCILELSRRECFQDMEFNIYGRGDRYEELVAPLRQFTNVKFYPQFFTHEEIAQIHKENGIGLFATRYDAQGVSMCETAMSGLAIVSSVNGAVQEFLPNDIGLQAETENYVQYADIIEELYNNPQRFRECAKQCHDKVAEKCCFAQTVQKEINLFAQGCFIEEKEREKIVGEGNRILSIVIPSYNVSEFLSHGVKTLLHQKNANKLDIIIVNDGSKDDTAEIARTLMGIYNDEEHPIIRLVDKENGGHGSTINEGIRVAEGKYLRVLDGDDWVESEQLEKLLDILDKEDSDIVITDYCEDLAVPSILVKRTPYESMIPEQKYNFDDLCYPGYGFGEWGPILATSNFKTEMLKNTNFKLTEKCFYVDMEFNMYSIIRAHSIVYYPLDIYRYFIGRVGQSVSQQSFKRNYLQHEKVLLNILNYVESLEGISEQKRNYIISKIVIPMVKAHYIIVKDYWGKRKLFNEFDQKMKQYMYVYRNQEITSISVRFHRKTQGFFMPFNKILKNINAIRKGE